LQKVAKYQLQISHKEFEFKQNEQKLKKSSLQTVKNSRNEVHASPEKLADRKLKLE